MHCKKENLKLLQATLRIRAAGVRSVEGPEGPPEYFTLSPTRMLPSGVYEQCSCLAGCCTCGGGTVFFRSICYKDLGMNIHSMKIFQILWVGSCPRAAQFLIGKIVAGKILKGCYKLILGH